MVPASEIEATPAGGELDELAADEAILLAAKVIEVNADFFTRTVMPRLDGLALLDTIKKDNPDVPIVMISGHGNIETAVKATKLGAFDFLEKPLTAQKVLVVVKNATQQTRLEREVRRTLGYWQSQTRGTRPERRHRQRTRHRRGNDELMPRCILQRLRKILHLRTKASVPRRARVGPSIRASV